MFIDCITRKLQYLIWLRVKRGSGAHGAVGRDARLVAAATECGRSGGRRGRRRRPRGGPLAERAHAPLAVASGTRADASWRRVLVHSSLTVAAARQLHFRVLCEPSAVAPERGVARRLTIWSLITR